MINYSAAIDEMAASLSDQLKQKRSPDGIWRGRLSSSAISTAVSVFALKMIDSERYAARIEAGAEWLKSDMRKDGSWGDSPESPPNLTATLLSYATLYSLGAAPQSTKNHLSQLFGGTADNDIIDGVMRYYGKDLTFSLPILVMCALCGVIHRWDKIPQLPFELSVLPQALFRFLRFPVVSYAIPALIAVGILRHIKGQRGIFSSVRDAFIPKALKVLVRLQPEHGGFLEAAPLTAFVGMCMSGAGYGSHPVTAKAAEFLANTARPDGSWPIDTDLSCWVTSLSARALGDQIEDKEHLAEIIKQNAFKFKHPFTAAKAGGWGWSDLSGAVPDADDTAGALVALHTLTDGHYSPEIGDGVKWLLSLQNSDGGMPTFCKGWGRLPFDRSSPDISAHALLAFELWSDSLPAALRKRCTRGSQRLLNWLRKNQAEDGSWTPLWFGDQDCKDERSPVYGTATAVEYLCNSQDPSAKIIAEKGMRYLLSAQNHDGGWGGAKDAPSKITLTGKALSALASYDQQQTEALKRGFEFLYGKYSSGELFSPEPIGLYFARLWYSEELYNYTFVLGALKKLKPQFYKL